MTDIIIQNVTQVAATLLITLIGVLGAWLTTKLAKKEELKNITAATNELVSAAQITVLELQQTVVDGWKELHADGKLTKDEIDWLGNTFDRLYSDSIAYNENLKKHQHELLTNEQSYQSPALNLSSYGITSGVYGYISAPSIGMKC